MKKIALVLGLLFIATVALSADPLTPLVYQYPVMGTPVDNTFKATMDNTAKSIQTLAETAGITWVQSGQTPHGVWISVETQNARWGTTGLSASGTVGHVIVKDTAPIHFAGAGFINALKLTSAAAGSYPVIQITLER
jgi:hypothetical protein